MADSETCKPSPCPPPAPFQSLLTRLTPCCIRRRQLSTAATPWRCPTCSMITEIRQTAAIGIPTRMRATATTLATAAPANSTWRTGTSNAWPRSNGNLRRDHTTAVRFVLLQAGETERRTGSGSAAPVSMQTAVSQSTFNQFLLNLQWCSASCSGVPLGLLFDAGVVLFLVVDKDVVPENGARSVSTRPATHPPPVSHDCAAPPKTPIRHVRSCVPLPPSPEQHQGR